MTRSTPSSWSKRSISTLSSMLRLPSSTPGMTCVWQSRARNVTGATAGGAFSRPFLRSQESIARTIHAEESFSSELRPKVPREACVTSRGGAQLIRSSRRAPTRWVGRFLGVGSGPRSPLENSRVAVLGITAHRTLTGPSASCWNWSFLGVACDIRPDTGPVIHLLRLRGCCIPFYASAPSVLGLSP